ncbi:ATP-binding protein [Thermoflexus sp.]|uniref:ATP-binding protein n=1 Tax=Thermoflexus sp. TaxID=1969742 RepID=UPI00262D216C|nr:ATP-binding protein [Thermoflexus sp.]MCX7691307.1 ATP-binding protein [Thermoflexus sp.]
MRLALWSSSGNLAWPDSLWGWGWTIVGFLTLFGLLLGRPHDLRSWRKLQTSEAGSFLLLIFLTSLTPVLSWDFPGLPFRVGFPVLLWLPYLIWGGRLQPGALGLAGLIMGAVIGFTSDGRFLHLPWIIALDAMLIGGLLSQNYVGRFFRILRQPLVAAMAGWMIWMLLQSISWGGFYPSWPEALDGIWTLIAVTGAPSGISALICGLIAQGLHLQWPRIFSTAQPPQWPPYARQIEARFLFFFSLWILTLIMTLFLFLTALAIRQANVEQTRAIHQGSDRAGEQISYFLHTGETLLADLAALGIPRDEPPALIAPILQRFVQTGPIYHAVLLTGVEGEILAAYPAGEQVKGLSTLERSALAQARIARAVIRTEVHRLPSGTPGLSFVAPLEGEPPAGFLIGRMQIGEHPALREALASLSGGLPGSEGFVIDRQGQILLHPDPQRLLDVFPLPTSALSRPFNITQRSPMGTIMELHIRRLPGTDWWAVIRYPRSARIQQALELILPSGIFLLTFFVIGALLLSTLSRQVTQRLKKLAAAAGRMAEGELETRILIDAPDEIGQLSEAMERMRHGLRARLTDLSLLLELNQRLVETVDLAHGLSEVARSLEQATQASWARILIPGARGSLRVFTATGERSPEPPDEACWQLGQERREPLWVEHVLRHPDLPSIFRQEDHGRELGILPIHSGEDLLGIAWIAFAQPRRMIATDQQLIRLILSQAAVFIARARLYEAALVERERLRAVLESSPDVLMLIDGRGDLLYLNPAAERFLGLPASRALGQPVAPLLKDAELRQLFDEQIPPGQIQSREFRRADGRAFWAGRYDLRLEDGQEIGRLLFVRDITPFKALDQLKSDFIAAVSHDLRSPLTYMRGFVTMLGMAGPLTSRQQEYVEKIMGGIDQMTRLIEDLMDLKRIEEGIGQRGICRLSDLIRDVFHEMRPQAMARGLRMTLEVKGHGIVNGDPTWLRRAITNLVDNALKYTPEGGTISLGLIEQNAEVIIWVRDTGLGIAPADQARIFEKFYRVRRKETAHVKGSGLGLALVKSIVEWHGGRVWVESQLGQGSTFYLAIPVATMISSSPRSR